MTLSNVLQECKINTVTADPCVACTNDYRICTACKAGNKIKILVDGSTVCELDNTSIPEGFGADTINNVIKPCKVEGCKTCSTDFNVCTVCFPILDNWSFLVGTQQ